MLEQIDFTAEKLDRDVFKSEYKELISKLVVLQQKARSAGVGIVVLAKEAVFRTSCTSSMLALRVCT